MAHKKAPGFTPDDITVCEKFVEIVNYSVTQVDL